MSDGIRSIAGVSTSVTAFVGRTLSGPTDLPTAVFSFAEFEGLYGGLWSESPLSHAVGQFFANGGREALVCRVRGSDDDSPITDDDVADPALTEGRRGIWMLDHVDTFNILCIPPLGPGRDVGAPTWAAAAAYARQRRAMVLVDPPSDWKGATDITPAALDGIIPDHDDRANAAIYFPAILAPDPDGKTEPRPFPPSGAVAGIYARTDAQRGVWKAPAGLDAVLLGVEGLTVQLTDAENGVLNPQAVNCLRTFPVTGSVVWGARTMLGRDGDPTDWKYVPVRRLGLFIEESIDRGTRWAVFEPNDEPLWAQLRQTVADFLHDLFRGGALQGQTAREAYFVKCDRETTTQTDIEMGLVNILLGFAPLKPAEFVIVRIQQQCQPPEPLLLAS